MKRPGHVEGDAETLAVILNLYTLVTFIRVRRVLDSSVVPLSYWKLFE